MNEKRADVLEVCSAELCERWSCDGSRLGMDPGPPDPRPRGGSPRGRGGFGAHSTTCKAETIGPFFF